MSNYPSELAMTDAHVALGERHIARQKEIISELALGGHPIALAETLLAAFEQTLIAHREHRERILAELASDG